MADARFGIVGEPDPNYILFIVLLTLLCTAITAIVYRQRTANFELRQTQARMLLAENATSVARLAAALSHELNNPMGALLSGIDTLLLLTSKQATCTPQEQPRLVVLQADRAEVDSAIGAPVKDFGEPDATVHESGPGGGAVGKSE